MSRDRPSTIWTYLGIGCAVVVGLGVLGAVTLGILAYRWVDDLKTTHGDPEARAQRVRELLGCEHLPDDYHAVAGIALPLLADVAILSDRVPDEDGQIESLGQRGLIYLRGRRFGPDEGELLDFFEGRTDRMRTRRWSGIHFRSGEIIRRGALDLHGVRLLYVVQRGTIEMDNGGHEGMTTLLLADCPEDERAHLGMWFGPDPGPGQGAEALDLTGTHGDERVIREFVEHFSFCRS